MGATRRDRSNLEAEVHDMLAHNPHWSMYHQILGFKSWGHMQRFFGKKGLSDAFGYLQEARRSQHGYVQKLSPQALAKREAHAGRIEDLEFMLNNGTRPDELVERLGYYNRLELYRSVYRAGRTDLLARLVAGGV